MFIPPGGLNDSEEVRLFEVCVHELRVTPSRCDLIPGSAG